MQKSKKKSPIRIRTARSNLSATDLSVVLHDTSEVLLEFKKAGPRVTLNHDQNLIRAIDTAALRNLLGNLNSIKVDAGTQRTILHIWEEHQSFSPVEAEPMPRVSRYTESIMSFVCPADQLEAVLGDLEENFCAIAAQRGGAAARRWYYWQVTWSVVRFAIDKFQCIVTLVELLRKLGL